MKKEGKKHYVYLFRHGQTTYNRDHRFTGHDNPKLTKQGIKHAKIIAEKLKKKTFQVAIHSHLSRSKDTLKYVLTYHPECKTILEDDRIIERSYGVLQGILHKTFTKEYGEDAFKQVHRGWNVKAKNGESFADVEKRVKSFIKDVKKFMKKNNVNVAISAHGNSIRLFRKIMEKATIKQTQSWNISYEKPYIYQL